MTESQDKSKRGDLLRLPELLASSTYVGSSGLSKQRKDRITGFHYFRARLRSNHVFLNVAEEVKRGKVSRYLYSITDKIKAI
ncbi:MAG: hypothetical protein K2H50_10355 [Paramuribaculum sp.]|nr:hypothetical protein [Paramuribaculum sp.]